MFGKTSSASSFDAMVDFIKSAWPARQYIVPCLQGPAGIGKTAAVKQAAGELGASKVVTIIASQILPNEVSGITMPVVESKAMEIFDHYRLSSLKDGDVLFFDELLEADQLVLSACLTLIESRELMSGRKLPDIMIVAATNPTIKPAMLKENIRQRFVWRKFGIDKEGTQNYIERLTGIKLPDEVMSMVTATGDQYNILTPRSLTKMCQWIADATDKDEAAKQINLIWNCSLGDKIKKAALHSDPMEKVRAALLVALNDACVDLASVDVVYDKDVFENSDLADVMSVVQSLPEWEQIKDSLSRLSFEEEDEVTF